MKKIGTILLGFILSVCFLNCFQYTFAQDQTTEGQPEKDIQGDRFTGKDPVRVLNDVYESANKDYFTEVQDTKLDTVTSENSSASSKREFTVTNTINWLVNNVHPYVQYFIYFCLILAVIFVILNGFKLIQEGEKGLAAFKKNIINLTIGIVLITAFYYIIDIFVALINQITGE